MIFSYTKKISWKLSNIENSISFALNEEGFSPISRIDMKDTIKKRIWKDIEDYIIIWTCNPLLSYELIVHKIEVWLFLPCNIIIYKKFNETYVSTITPSVLNNIIEDKEIQNITKMADLKLKRVIDSL